MRTMKMTLVLLALAGSGWTMDGPPPGGKPDHDGPGDRMGAWLNLTPEQADKIQALRQQHRKATRDLRDRRQDAMRALRHLVEDKGTDAQIAAKLADLKAAHEALHAAQQKQRDEIAKLLTPTQQAKFLIGMQRRGGPGRRGMGRGGRGRDRRPMHDPGDHDEAEDDD